MLSTVCRSKPVGCSNWYIADVEGLDFFSDLFYPLRRIERSYRNTVNDDLIPWDVELWGSVWEVEAKKIGVFR